jgi:hypothetical protein
MIIIAGALVGAGYGAWLARRRDGRPADIAQYAAGFGLAAATVGVFVTVFIGRMG